MRKNAVVVLGLVAWGPVLVVACGGSSASPNGSASGGSAGAAGSSSSHAGSVASGGASSSGAGGGSQVAGAAGDAAGGAAAAGGTASGACGGKVCGVGQICCGPAECGHCISELSGQACPNTCPTGEGGSGGTPDCTQLLADVTKTQAAAQACNPASAKPIPECAGSLDGVCCPIGVEAASATAPDNAAYLSALKAYKASCAHPCPRIACIAPMVGNCKASGASYKCAP